ncbi:hypothetical protein MRX96_058516 [Rhipicephalus microplus]
MFATCHRKSARRKERSAAARALASGAALRVRRRSGDGARKWGSGEAKPAVSPYAADRDRRASIRRGPGPLVRPQQPDTDPDPDASSDTSCTFPFDPTTRPLGRRADAARHCHPKGTTFMCRAICVAFLLSRVSL